MKDPDRQLPPGAPADDGMLQLPPEVMEIGDNRQLSTTLIQQLDQAASQLNAWIAGGERKGADDVRRHVKGFLIGMNVYPRLPLGFRLQALDELAPACRTCDSRIILAMLAAYQQILVQLADEQYAPYRIRIMAHAINHTTRFYRYCLAAYKSLDVRVINRVLRLPRIGTELLTTSGNCETEVRGLKRAICRHELMRRIDFFGQTGRVQEQLWQDVNVLSEEPDVHYFEAGEKLPRMAETAFLVSDLNKPASSPTVVSRLPADVPHATWIIPIQALLGKARQMRQQYRLLGRDGHTQGAPAADEATLLASIECILDSLGKPRRHSNRKTQAGRRIWLEWNAGDAIASWQGDVRPQHRQPAPWTIIDIHEGGMGLECTGRDTVRADVGALVGIRWPVKSGHPRLGFLRWRRTGEDGTYRLGIEFFRLDAVVKKCITAGDNPMRRVIPVLFPASAGNNTAIFPVARLRTGTDYVLLDAEGRTPVRITGLMKTGPNYTVCKIEKSGQGGGKT